MNFLAHLYLSGDSNEIRLGNFIADFVKGNAYTSYPKNIQKGVIVHRSIDDFTDHHPLIIEAMTYFRGNYHKYSGIIIDILFDHFLVYNWNSFCKLELNDFINTIYKLVENNMHFIPKKMKSIAPRFIAQKWLNNYGSLKGIERVYNGMSRHTSLPAETKFAMHIINKNYEKLNALFLSYFPELVDFIGNKYEISLPPNKLYQF